MTAICASGGASAIKPGVAAAVVFDVGLITAGLALIDPLLIPVAALIDAFTYDALSQCTTDPPPMPSAADLNIVNAIGGVLNGNFGTWLTAVNDLLLNWAWQQYCQCSAGAAPVFVYPPPPTGSQSGSGSTSSPCVVGAETYTPYNPSGDAYLDHNLYGILPPGTQLIIETPYDGGPYGPLPASVVQLYSSTVTSGQIQVNISAAAGTGRIYFTLYCWSASYGSGLPFAQTLFLTPSGGVASGTLNVTVPANTVYMYAGIQCYDVPYYTSTAQISAVWYCGGASSTSTTSCCVDPTTLNGLNNIYSLLLRVYSTLQVRAPTYVASTVHAGLTGGVNFTVPATTLALQIEFTSLPISYGEEVGFPNRYYGLGEITPATAYGPEAAIRLTRTTQVVELPQATTSVDCWFPGGGVATVTELEAG